VLESYSSTLRASSVCTPNAPTFLEAELHVPVLLVACELVSSNNVCVVHVVVVLGLVQAYSLRWKTRRRIGRAALQLVEPQASQRSAVSKAVPTL
jgi:hypothetical protein